MSAIAMLGLGAMGSRMATHLIKAGHQVTVWNRSAAAAEPLLALGAQAAVSPKQAAQGAELVIAMLRDNEASREVWLDPHSGAAAGMLPDAIAVESSTLTADWIRELGDQLAQRGLALLEAPVSGSTPQAEAAQLVYLVGGDAELLARAEPVLKLMGSSIQHAGPLGAGALAKLATNTLMGVQVTAIAELIGMLQHSGADAAKILDAVGATPVWSIIAGRVRDSMLAGNFKPLFPVELIEKDFRYTIHGAAAVSKVPTIEAARQVFQRAIERGYGKEQMTAVVKLFAES